MSLVPFITRLKHQNFVRCVKSFLLLLALINVNTTSSLALYHCHIHYLDKSATLFLTLLYNIDAEM